MSVQESSRVRFQGRGEALTPEPKRKRHVEQAHRSPSSVTVWPVVQGKGAPWAGVSGASRELSQLSWPPRSESLILVLVVVVSHYCIIDPTSGWRCYSNLHLTRALHCPREHLEPSVMVRALLVRHFVHTQLQPTFLASTGLV